MIEKENNKKQSEYSNYEPVYTQAFNNDEVDKIIKLSANYQSQQAEIGYGGEGSYNPSKRRSHVKWIPSTPENIWIYTRFEQLVKQVNNNYGFEIVGGEPIQYTEYSESEAGEYNWHTDYSIVNKHKYMRKISVSIFLTDKHEYVGGDFILTTYVDDLFIPEQKKGYGVVFPSWYPHRVTPVVRGLRKSLVMWVYGPHFK